jgi:hypothetical protein
VWIEKDALIGVIEGVCGEYRCPHFATRGNNSQSNMRSAGVRFKNLLLRDVTPVILHLADHDPNGIDMTRDIQERMSMFAGDEIEVRRIALTIEQVRQYNPPANFAKDDDNHKAAYVQRFGTEECWELDALEPQVIDGLIRAELEQLIDEDEWEEKKAQEKRNRDLLTKVSENWPKVKAAVQK